MTGNKDPVFFAQISVEQSLSNVKSVERNKNDATDFIGTVH